MARSFPIRLRTIAAATVVIASGLMIFTSYQSIIQSSEETPQALPIIYAETEPFRVPPEDPGGAEILNKDSTLFELMDADRDDPLSLGSVKLKKDTEDEPTTLLAPAKNPNAESGFALPEIPEKRTESLYGMIDDLKDQPENTPEENDDNDPSKVTTEEQNKKTALEGTEPLDENETQELKNKLQNVIEQVEQDNAQKEIANVITEKPENIITPSKKPSVPTRTPAKKETASAPATTNPATKGREAFSLDKVLSAVTTKKGHYIQLASLRSEADARAAYDRIRTQFPNLVRDVGVVFPKADLGARGTFTRIQVGPMTASEARKRCADYSASAKGGTCLVVSR